MLHRTSLCVLTLALSIAGTGFAMEQTDLQSLREHIDQELKADLSYALDFLAGRSLYDYPGGCEAPSKTVERCLSLLGRAEVDADMIDSKMAALRSAYQYNLKHRKTVKIEKCALWGIYFGLWIVFLGAEDVLDEYCSDFFSHKLLLLAKVAIGSSLWAKLTPHREGSRYLDRLINRAPPIMNAQQKVLQALEKKRAYD